MFECVVTNMPGSRAPPYLCGAKMIAMYGTAPLFDSMGLICPVYSDGDTIAVSFTADRAMMPDPDRFAAALRGAFEGVRDAVQPVPGPAVQKRGTKPPAPAPAAAEGA